MSGIGRQKWAHNGDVMVKVCCISGVQYVDTPTENGFPPPGDGDSDNDGVVLMMLMVMAMITMMAVVVVVTMMVVVVVDDGIGPTDTMISLLFLRPLLFVTAAWLFVIAIPQQIQGLLRCLM